MKSISEKIAVLLLQRINKINFNAILRKAVITYSVDLSDLNREQLNKGLKANGVSLSPYVKYSYKKRFKPKDLKLTGEFHNDIYAKPFGDAFSMENSNWKLGFLQHNNGREILGLTQRNTREAGRIMLPAIIKGIRDAI